MLRPLLGFDLRGFGLTGSEREVDSIDSLQPRQQQSPGAMNSVDRKEEVEETQADRREDADHYTMSITRKTVDKLGVKLYDRVSAVVAELVANAYDADAETVVVRVPLGTVFSTKNAPDPGDEGAYYIEVEDDGHGMTPSEAEDHFLRVGHNRREVQGALSRHKKRNVMGRKGIGKLAPFGICNRMEVLSAGEAQEGGEHPVSHFILNYDEILKDTEEDYIPERGDRDRTTKPETGTVVRLTHFKKKRVPNRDTFMRQLARRFGLEQEDFKIEVEDIRHPDAQRTREDQGPRETVGRERIHVETMDDARIDLSDYPVPTADGELPVEGWMGVAEHGYKHEELAGVRIYARGKIVSTTRDFQLMSGFTGEQTIRSYLVGEVHADWLDQDEGEDLIKTDRQDIIWDSDYGQALKRWGKERLKELGKLSFKPRRRKVRKQFLDVANVRERAEERYGDARVVETAMELAKQIGGLAAEDELEDEEYVSAMTDVILSVAPHQTLIEAFQEFSERAVDGSVSLDSLVDLFDRTRVAEMASYSQVAAQRVRSIERLEKVIDDAVDEQVLQDLITEAPWLLDPEWSVITMDEALRTFVRRFASYWEEEHGDSLSIGLPSSSSYPSKRPDFTAIQTSRRLRIVELKSPTTEFDNNDFDRLQNYVQAFRKFFEINARFEELFPNGWQIDLITPATNITDDLRREAFSRYRDQGEVEIHTWDDFLLESRNAHEEFLRIREEALRAASEAEAADAAALTGTK